MNHYDSNYAANLDRDDEPPDDDEVITCWCGAKGTYDELFSEVDDNCGGTGFVECYCGGDQCVCHRHGQEVECPGCDECPERDDDGFDDDDYDPHDD